MWASSLRTAAYIASFAIEVPSILTLYKSGKATVQVTLDEKDKFARCVDTQMNQCQESLNVAIELETHRTILASDHNTQVVNRIKESSDDCAADYILLKSAMEEWVAENQDLPVNNATCSPEDQEAIMNTIIAVETFKTEAFAVSAQFERDSKSTMSNMIRYAQQRIAYDTEYLDNHTITVKAFFDERFQMPSFDVSETIEDAMESIGNLTSCLQFKAEPQCEFQEGIESSFKSAHELLSDFKERSFESTQAYVDDIKGKYDGVHGKLVDYHADVKDKLEVVGNFIAGESMIVVVDVLTIVSYEYV